MNAKLTKVAIKANPPVSQLGGAAPETQAPDAEASPVASATWAERERAAEPQPQPPSAAAAAAAAPPDMSAAAPPAAPVSDGPAEAASGWGGGWRDSPDSAASQGATWEQRSGSGGSSPANAAAQERPASPDVALPAAVAPPSPGSADVSSTPTGQRGAPSAIGANNAEGNAWGGAGAGTDANAAGGNWGGGGGWERAFRRDDELLRACGFWCKKVEADGACLFRAFSDQLQGDGGSGHMELRKKCVAFLESNKAEFAPFVEGNFKAYCSRLSRPTEFAGEMEVQALSRTLGVNALIHRPAEANGPEEVPALQIEVVNFPEDAPCVQICFHPRYHAGPHYNSVRFLGDSGEGAPSTTLAELRAASQGERRDRES